MTAVTGVKAGPVGRRISKIKSMNYGLCERLILGGEKTQFRTKMVNGKAQIYFDALGQSNI